MRISMDIPNFDAHLSDEEYIGSRFQFAVAMFF